MRPRANQKSPSAFTSSVEGLSLVSGIVVAFLLSPQIYALSSVWVGDYSNTHYGAGTVELSRAGWLIVLAFFLFFLTRALCVATLSGLSLWLGTKLISRH